MRLRGRSVSAVALLACLAVTSACSAEPEKPSLEEAAKQLIADGDKLVTFRELSTAATVSVTERADKDSEVGCLQGQIQRFFRAQGDFNAPPAVTSPSNSAGLMLGKLESLGYDKIVDELDLRDENLGVTLSQNLRTGLTFLVTVRNRQKPNIVIVGKTSCYERGG